LQVAPPVGGDELQIIKRGITEVADMISFHRQRRRNWQTAVQTCSAHTGAGVDGLRRTLEECRISLSESGELAEVRGKLIWATEYIWNAVLFFWGKPWLLTYWAVAALPEL